MAKLILCGAMWPSISSSRLLYQKVGCLNPTLEQDMFNCQSTSGNRVYLRKWWLHPDMTPYVAIKLGVGEL